MKKVFFTIFLVIISVYTIAESTASSIKMKVVFSGESESSQISNAKVESYTVSCSGESTSEYPNGYIYNGSTYDGKSILDLSISGPFREDSRTTCKIYYDDGSYDKIFFSLENIVISYIKNNIKYTCRIGGKVGTGYDFNSERNDKLQAQYRKITKPCVNDNSNTDTYVITPGKDDFPYDPGKITINLK